MGIDVGRRRLLLGLALLLAALSACDEEEGCLDYRARNIDIYAEKACDDCCVYPSLQLQQIPSRFENGVRQTVARGTPLIDAAGDTARITALLYFLHDVELEYADGTVVPVLDTFSFRQNEDLDFTLAERSLLRAQPLQTARLESGELLVEGVVSAIRFKFGLPSEFEAFDPVAQRRGSPLLLQGPDTLLTSGTLATGRQYRSGFVRVQRTDGTRDSSFVVGPAAVPYRYALPTAINLRRSNDLSVTLQLPVTPLVNLPSGAIAAEVFAGAFLEDARVIQ